MSTNAAQITTKRAVKILGYSDRSSIIALVNSHELTPATKFPGKTGGFTFFLADIIALAEKRQAERQEVNAELDRHLDAAREAAELDVSHDDLEKLLELRIAELGAKAGSAAP